MQSIFRALPMDLQLTSPWRAREGGQIIGKLRKLPQQCSLSAAEKSKTLKPAFSDTVITHNHQTSHAKTLSACRVVCEVPKAPEFPALAAPASGRGGRGVNKTLRPVTSQMLFHQHWAGPHPWEPPHTVFVGPVCGLAQGGEVRGS